MLEMCSNLVHTFQVASDKYYRDMLDPSYKKIKGTLKEKLELDNPPTISVGLDGWSAHHHGYAIKIHDKSESQFDFITSHFQSQVPRDECPLFKSCVGTGDV